MSLLREAERFGIDSALACNFAVEIDGFMDSGFKQVSGLEEAIIFHRIKEYNSPIESEIPNGIALPDVTLRKGIVFGSRLYQWYTDCRDWQPGQPDYRKNISIIQLKLIRGIPVEADRWDLYDAYVKRYRAPNLNSKTDDVSVQEVVIGRSVKLDKPVEYEADTNSGVIQTVKNILGIV